MNRRHPVDEFFRDKLEHHSAEPPAGMWERIEEERKRSVVATVPAKLSGWWLLAAAFIAVLAPLTEWHAPLHDGQSQNPSVIAALEQPARPAASAVENTYLAEAENSQSALSQPTAETGISRNIEQEARHTEQAFSADAYSLRAQRPDVAAAPVTVSTHQLVYDAAPAESIAEEQPRTLLASFDPLPLRQNYAFGNNRSGAFPASSQCATFKNMGLRYFLELHASPDVAFRQISPAGDSPEQAAFAQNRHQTERPFYNYSFGARLAASTRFGLVLRTGFDYAQINERLRYITETEERFTIINIIGPGGNVTGVDTLYETIVHEHTAQNSYRTLSIPVLAGYELPIKRWLFTAQGGVLFNLLFTQQGSMFVPGADMPVRFSTIEQEGRPVFKSKLGLGWYASLGAAYKIRHNMYLTAEPHLRAFPGSVTHPSFDTKQTYLSGGLALGLKMQL